ncbi:MAG: hypothetical protein Kow0069_20590 [Promethearchaeota archaeon]
MAQVGARSAADGKADASTELEEERRGERPLEPVRALQGCLAIPLSFYLLLSVPLGLAGLTWAPTLLAALGLSFPAIDVLLARSRKRRRPATAASDPATAASDPATAASEGGPGPASVGRQGRQRSGAVATRVLLIELVLFLAWQAYLVASFGR